MVTGVTPGDTVEVSIFYPNPDGLDPSSLTAKKYFPDSASYVDLPTTAPTNTTITSLVIDSEPTIQLTYNLIDGGDFDLDEAADGEITDPVSLAQAVTATETATDEQESLADTGQSQPIVLISSVIVLGAAGLGLRRRLL